MWQIAIYNEHQHDQFRATGARFALVKGPDDIAWRFAEQGAKSRHGTSIEFRIQNDCLIVDGREMDASVQLADGAAFSCGVPVELPLPGLFQLGDTWIEVRAVADGSLLGLEPIGARHKARADQEALRPGRAPDGETIAKWLAAASQLHRMAASSPGFFDAAAQIALDCTGLDQAMVVMQETGQWRIVGSALLAPEHGVSFDYGAVELMHGQPDVWRRAPRVAGDDDVAKGASRGESIIVAPILDEAGRVVAAMYGSRHSQGRNRRRGIRTLEARVVETIAEAVSAGIIRRQAELDAARQRVLLEQAFSPAAADYLLRHPEALFSQSREVTLLFADLRGFTRLADNLPATEACSLIGEVMDMLTQAILDHGGMVVDYYGDGVSAMWNAPLDTPDHADRACAAAIEMIENLPAISRRWEQLLADPLQLGVGVHSGSVQVGNAGAQRRPKYGPRGTAVNTASRVQAAAKRLDVPILTTNAVRQRLSSRFVTLKVCTARLPGLEEPMELFTLFPAAEAGRLQDDLEQYAAALDAFERGDFDTAEAELTELLAAGPATPAAFLAQQTAALRRSGQGRRADDEFAFTPDAVIEILAK